MTFSDSTPTPSAPNQESSSSSSDAPEIVDPIPAVESFDEMNLSAAILENVNKAGFKEPSPIQKSFIPKAMAGRDVMGQAKTGTGKTAAFLLPTFQRLLENQAVKEERQQDKKIKTRVLVLSPTRELSVQIQGEVNRLSSGLGLRSVNIYGGSDYRPQIEALHKGVDIVVGTPGRIMDHLRSRNLTLGDIEIAVLDEADRMLDLGFRKDIEYILRHCPKKRQTLLLSATFPDDILRLTRRFMDDPLEVWTESRTLTVDQVKQFYSVCTENDKLPILLKILDEQKPECAIVFCRTKKMTRILADRLRQRKINVRDLHGDLDQRRREKIIKGFRNGQIRIMVATDVAARGLDISGITHVINYDVPHHSEDYVHRIGRTARMGRSGWAATLLSKDEAELLTEIEILINAQLETLSYESLDSYWWPNSPEKPSAEDEEYYTPPPPLKPAPEKHGFRGRRGSFGGNRRSGGGNRGNRSNSPPRRNNRRGGSSKS